MSRCRRMNAPTRIPLASRAHSVLPFVQVSALWVTGAASATPPDQGDRLSGTTFPLGTGQQGNPQPLLEGLPSRVRARGSASTFRSVERDGSTRRSPHPMASHSVHQPQPHLCVAGRVRRAEAHEVVPGQAHQRSGQQVWLHEHPPLERIDRAGLIMQDARAQRAAASHDVRVTPPARSCHGQGAGRFAPAHPSPLLNPLRLPVGHLHAPPSGCFESPTFTYDPPYRRGRLRDWREYWREAPREALTCTFAENVIRVKHRVKVASRTFRGCVKLRAPTRPDRSALAAPAVARFAGTHPVPPVPTASCSCSSDRHP